MPGGRPRGSSDDDRAFRAAIANITPAGTRLHLFTPADDLMRDQKEPAIEEIRLATQSVCPVLIRPAAQHRQHQRRNATAGRNVQRRF
jgi:hypothetical protein